MPRPRRYTEVLELSGTFSFLNIFTLLIIFIIALAFAFAFFFRFTKK